MEIDWGAVATIAAAFITLIGGALLNRYFQKRPALISYFSHVSSFNFTPQHGGQTIVINTHSVILRNSGKLNATNVRLNHRILPDFNIYPSINYSTVTLPNGTQDILIPTLIPGEEITISYLYFPPLTADQIHSGIKSDQGFAKPIYVLLQRQFPRWLIRTEIILTLIGIIAVFYLGYEAVAWAIDFFQQLKVNPQVFLDKK